MNTPVSPLERPHKVRALRKVIQHADSEVLISDFINNFMQPTSLLDEVLEFDGTMFGDSELMHLVPSSPSSSSSSPSPLSSPDYSDELDGYWSYSPNTHHDLDIVDIDADITGDFISDILFSPVDCISIVNI